MYNIEDIDLFPCYSIPLMRWLTNTKKIKYKLIGLNPKSNKKFYVFIDNEKLNDALKEWKETKILD